MTTFAQSLSIMAVLRDSLRLFHTHWKRHFTLSFACAAPLALLYGIGFFEPLVEAVRRVMEAQGPEGSGTAATVELPPGVSLRFFAVAAFSLLLVSAYATGWWWGIFGLEREDSQERPTWLQAYAATLSRLFLFGAIMLGAFMGLMFVSGNILAPMLGAVGAGPLLLIIFLAAEFLFFGIAMRLGLALPPASWGEEVPFSTAWSASRGLTIRLGVVAIILTMLALLVSLLLQEILTPSGAGMSGWSAALPVFLASPVSFLIYALPFSALATVFLQLRENKQL